MFLVFFIFLNIVVHFFVFLHFLFTIHHSILFLIIHYSSFANHIHEKELVFSSFSSVNFSSSGSGVRAVVIDVDGRVQFDSSLSWARPDDPDEWLRAADTLLGEIPLASRR